MLNDFVNIVVLACNLGQSRNKANFLKTQMLSKLSIN